MNWPTVNLGTEAIPFLIILVMFVVGLVGSFSIILRWLLVLAVLAVAVEVLRVGNPLQVWVMDALGGVLAGIAARVLWILVKIFWGLLQPLLGNFGAMFPPEALPAICALVGLFFTARAESRHHRAQQHLPATLRAERVPTLGTKITEGVQYLVSIW